MSNGSSRRVSLYWAHPFWLLVPLGLGVIGVATAFTKGYSPRDLYVSFLCGFSVGLPIVLAAKWFLRKNKDSFVEYAMLPSSDQLQWPWQKTNLSLTVPLLLLSFAIEFVTNRLHAPWMPGRSLFCILVILAYPEQKAIYLAAKARLEEDRPQMDANA